MPLGPPFAVLLYADDAALPADSAEDLQLAARIVEEFFNNRQLFTSTPKTFITVFHSTTDAGVTYNGSEVLVDGAPVHVHIYNELIKATPNFKYLGVHFNESGNNSTHMHERSNVVHISRASSSLLSSLRHIPSYPFEIILFLWRTLVVPVVCYGFEAYARSEVDVLSFQKHEQRIW